MKAFTLIDFTYVAFLLKKNKKPLAENTDCTQITPVDATRLKPRT